MIKPGPVFTRPRTPAAKCLHLIRLNPIITRSEIVEATGLSQPTITRATSALLGSGLIQERSDLTRSCGRGRPTVPLEAAENGWMLAGIAVGTLKTFIALYDTNGRTIREQEFSTPVATLSEDDFIEHIMAGVNRLKTGLDRRLVSVGVATSGSVDEEGRVTAPNLGWEDVDIAGRLRYQFGVPVVVSSAIPAILGSETQPAELGSTDSALVLFADDSIGAAYTLDDQVTQVIPLPAISSALLGEGPAEQLLSTRGVLRHTGAGTVAAAASSEGADREVLSERARQLGTITATLAREHRPTAIVIAGGAFLDDPLAPKLFAAQVREGVDYAPQLRMIPSHGEVVRAVARAVAIDPLLRVPLDLGKSMQPA